MLTRLRFKNWRSLKDASIEFTTPITVLIGANASGKTNVVDGLRFLRDMLHYNTPTTTYYAWERRGAKTINSKPEDSLLLEIVFDSIPTTPPLKYSLSFEFNNNELSFEEALGNPGQELLKATNGKGTSLSLELETLGRLTLPLFNFPVVQVLAAGTEQGPQAQKLYFSIESNWHILGEGFNPALSNPTNETIDPFLITPNASNAPAMLYHLRKYHSGLYAELQQDVAWLLGHVDKLEVENTERETRFFLREKTHPDREAPTISAGTARIIAMLLPFYLLETRFPDIPGLVVIEEPDTALNPGLLERFVDQLRAYTTRKDRPRQLILTTHNPTLLNYFKPEEVRVVERDEQGYTTIHPVPDRISESWLREHLLGEAWTARIMGGVPR